MTDNIMVMPGQVSFDLGAAHSLAEEFGWTVKVVEDLHEAVARQAFRRAPALLFHRDALGCDSWLEAVRLVKSALPDVLPVVCHGFSEPIDWPVLCDAGAFHSLWLPLRENELRRSFGFIWAADKRLAEATYRVPLIVPVRKRSTPQRIRPTPDHDVRNGDMASEMAEFG